MTRRQEQARRALWPVLIFEGAACAAVEASPVLGACQARPYPPNSAEGVRWRACHMMGFDVCSNERRGHIGKPPDCRPHSWCRCGVYWMIGQLGAKGERMFVDPMLIECEACKRKKGKQ